MYHITREAEYNTACLSTGREVFPRVTFTTLSPHIIVDKSNIQSISLNEIVNNTSETLTMGCACSNKVDVDFIQEPTNKIFDSIGNIEGLKMYIEVGVKVANEDIVYAPLGYFTISDVEITNNGTLISTTAYDCISKLNQPYSPEVNLDRATLQDVYDDLKAQILVQTDLVLADRECPTEEYFDIINIAQDNTLQQVLNNLAGMLGGFAHINRDGIIEIVSCLDENSKWYADSGVFVGRNLQFMDGLKKTTNTSKKITYIESGTNGFEVAAGNSLPGTKIWFEDQYMTENAINDIFNVIEDLEYQPCELRWVGNPLLEAGDRITTQFATGNEVSVDATTFKTQISNSGRYIFIYDGEQWNYDDDIVTLGNYGISITHEDPIAGDFIIVDFTDGETPRAKVNLIYQKNVFIMSHTLTIDGGISDTIECYGQTNEDSELAWNIESASNVSNKMFSSLKEQILEITSNMTGTDGGYVILHKRGDRTRLTTDMEDILFACNSSKFADNFHIAGTYEFVYSGDHWTYGNQVVDIESVGITYKNGEPTANGTVTVTLSFDAEYPDEILVMDRQSINNSLNVWRFNQNGLAHSSTGYNGPYTTAITQDGKIVGSFIAANSISLNQIRPEAVTQITSNLVNHAVFNEFSDSVYEQIQQAESEAVQLANDELTEYKNKVAQYLTFNGENGLIIGAVNSNFKTNLTNTKLSFIENNNEVAYISNEEFFITNGNILSRLNIGNFKFVPRSNGNLSLVYEEVNS